MDQCLIPVRAIFASDVDGTLVDRDDGIHPRDRRAIARAREQGVAFTLATGRLTTRTHPVARALSLDAPMVCADGGIIACAATERVLSRRAIALEHVEAILIAFAEHELSSFVFTHGAIHSCERGRAHHGYVQGWASDITTHKDVLVAEAWRGDAEATVMVVGIGTDEAIGRVEALLAALDGHVDALTFTSSGHRVIRLVSRGTSKGAALADVAQRLGVARERVAVIGDWYNDLPMFDWAARSFAMPHAPDEVKAAATDVLGDGACGRGAIAEALEAWLDQLDRGS
ncbi:MAG TPA: Cof-type HAD-IIB family hydrolase [Kofleriaceae bacterium]|nr:Cof-type HAD-IIB family hydrolase [Kofleriaceae bacterium]